MLCILPLWHGFRMLLCPSDSKEHYAAEYVLLVFALTSRYLEAIQPGACFAPWTCAAFHLLLLLT